MEVVSRTKKENDFKVSVSGNTKMPSHQIQRTIGREDTYTIDAQPQFPTTSINNGQEVYYDTEINDFPSVKDMWFRFTITPEAEVVAAPGQYLIKRLICESNKGIGDELFRYYPEQNILYNYLTLNCKQRHARQESEYYKILNSKNKTYDQIGTDETKVLKSGKSYDIYVQIPCPVIRMNSIDGRLNDEVRFRIQFNENWSSQNVLLNSTSLIIRSVKQSDSDNIEHIQYNKMYHHKYLYLDVERLQITGQTFTSGSQYRVDMENFVGDCPFLLVCLKDKNGNPVPQGKDQWNMVEIGPNGTFDLESSSGQSLISNGRPLKQNYIYDLFSDETEQNRLKGYYIIQFCENLKAANIGNQNGGHTFQGQKDYLSIVFGQAPVSEVYTFTIATGGAAAGKWYIDTPIRPNNNQNNFGLHNPFDATTTEIGQAFDNYYGITGTTVVGTFDQVPNNSTVVITIPSKYGSLIKTYGKPRLINTLSGSVSLTSYTLGEDGFVSGNDYILEVYMYYYKCLEINKNGRISCKKLINGKGYNDHTMDQPKLSKYRGELLY